MAGKSKSATSTPRAPASKASADMLNTTARSRSLEAAGTATPTATPRSIATKRKAGDDARAPGGVGSSSAKKPKVSIHTITTVTPSSSGKKSSRPETHRHSSAHVELPLASTTTTTTMTPPAKPSGSGKRIVFDDNDDEENENEDNDTTTGEFHTPREAPPHNPIEAQLLSLSADGDKGGIHDDGSGSDSDSDDEAPEAVSTSTAAAQAAQATQAAARAAEKQEEALRRKRQERDSRFRAQAESRKRQQKREEEEEEAAAAAQKKKGVSDDSDDDSDDKVPASTGAQTLQEPRTITSTKASSRRRLDRRALPAVLPDEFLASDSDSDSGSGAGDDVQGRRRKKGPPGTHSINKTTKFNTVARQVARAEARHQQQPADARVGATVYRVAKKPADGKLAPRGGKHSRNAREGLLQRGRAVPATTGAGKKKGFLVKR